MTRVWLEPCDIVFFRDDLPFGVEGSQIARCQFPPRPSVIAGALRTKVLSSEGVDFDGFRSGEGVPPLVRAEIGSGRGRDGEVAPGSFRLTMLALGHRKPSGEAGAYFRIGRDLVMEEKAARAVSRPVGMLAPAMASRLPGRSSLGGLTPLAVTLGYGPRGGWLEGAGYVAYLQGRSDLPLPLSESSVVEREFRVGIGLAWTTRTVDEGRLYSGQGVVMKPGWGFVVGVEGCTLVPTTGLVRLGGDGRMARLAPWDAADPDWSPVRDQVASSGRFRWVLQTPAIFRKGWLPDAIEETTEGLAYRGGSFRARLVSAAVGAPELAGGWDLVRGGPKPFRQMAPAGSVYWFEVIDGDREAPWLELHGQSVSDERAQEGFGLVHVGGWSYV